jgi:hypothetical protein
VIPEKNNLRQLRVCYVLSYRDPKFQRTQSLINALSGIDHTTLFQATNTYPGFNRYYQTFKKVWRIHHQFSPDVYVLGFRGHEIYWPLRWIVGEKPIIFDSLVSPCATLVEERKHGYIGRLFGLVFLQLEKSILRNANFVLTDTQLHSNYFHDKFEIEEGRLLSVPVGAIESFTDTTKQVREHNNDMSVLFYGSFLPLHGISVIVKAAAQLKGYPIRFDFIGGNKKQVSALRKLCSNHGVDHYTHRHWVPLDALINTVIPNSDLCLCGPFGNTPQANRVVTSKTYQCLALGKPAIIGTIDEDYGLRDKENCLLVRQGCPSALAESILWCWENRKQLDFIGHLGRVLYEQSLSIDVIRKKLALTLNNFRNNE